MRALAVFITIFAVAVLVSWYLWAPEHRSDLSWLVLTLPLVLLIVREVYERLPGDGGDAGRGRYLPIDIEPDDDAGDPDSEEIPLLAGFWTGNLKLYRSRAHDPMQALPLKIGLRPKGHRLELESFLVQPASSGIEHIAVIEYDDRTGDLDLQIDLKGPEDTSSVLARLKYDHGRLITEDSDDEIVAELRRARLILAET